MLQRVVTVFCRKFFCLKVPKKIVEEHFCAVFQKNSMEKKRGYQDFPSKNLCLTMPNSFVGEHFSSVFQRDSDEQKDYG